jgi:hypothetical protein
VRIFKDKGFCRFAEKEGIADDLLRKAAANMEQGLWDADLGGNVYKQRVASPGEGKRSGYRTIIFYRSGESLFFKYGFPKSERDNIGADELRVFKREAKQKLGMTKDQIEAMLDKGTLFEIV